MMSAPLARTSSGRTALTVAAVPTGMKAGVLISPRCMAMTPVRAAPSVAAIEKEKRVTLLIRNAERPQKPCWRIYVQLESIFFFGSHQAKLRARIIVEPCAVRLFEKPRKLLK